jgi:hypothetical protein
MYTALKIDINCGGKIDADDRCIGMFAKSMLSLGLKINLLGKFGADLVDEWTFSFEI